MVALRFKSIFFFKIQYTLLLQSTIVDLRNQHLQFFRVFQNRGVFDLRKEMLISMLVGTYATSNPKLSLIGLCSYSLRIGLEIESQHLQLFTYFVKQKKHVNINVISQFMFP